VRQDRQDVAGEVHLLGRRQGAGRDGPGGQAEAEAGEAARRYSGRPGHGRRRGCWSGRGGGQPSWERRGRGGINPPRRPRRGQRPRPTLRSTGTVNFSSLAKKETVTFPCFRGLRKEKV